MFRKAFRSALGNALMPAWVYGAKALGKLGINFHVPDMIADGATPYMLVKSVSSTMRAPIFASAIPDLKIVHIVRHPAGVLASIIRGREAGKMQGEVHLDELFQVPEAGDYGFSYEDIANASYAEQQAFRWMVRNDFVRRHLWDSPNYLFVSYEKLCGELEAETERLCHFLNLPMEAQMREQIRQMTTGPADDASYFSVVRNSISALARWEKQLSAQEAAAIVGVVERSELGRQTIAEYNTQRARLDQ